MGTKSGESVIDRINHCYIKMPQRVSKVIDYRRPSPTIRRDENMRLQDPHLRLHDGQWVEFARSDRTSPPRTFRDGREADDQVVHLFEQPTQVPRARVIAMPADHNVLAHARNAAPMQIDRTTS